eukprot:gene38289-51713_t
MGAPGKVVRELSPEQAMRVALGAAHYVENWKRYRRELKEQRSNAMAYEFIKVDRNGPITTFTLNRPDVMNAMHSFAHFEMDDAVNAFAADPEQWVGIVTGAGERAFSAGNDLKHQATGGKMGSPPSGFAGLTSRFDLTKPLASPSQPFDLVAERHVGWGELPWRGIGAWALAMAVLMAGQLLSAPMSDLVAKLPGVACIMGTALMFAAGAVVTKRWPVTLAPVPLVGWQLAIGMVPMLLLSLIFEHWTVVKVTPLGWAAVVYVGVFAMCVSYLAWFRALKLLPASTAAIGTLLVPVIGVASSAWALGEPLGPRQLIALALTVSGVVLASRG